MHRFLAAIPHVFSLVHDEIHAIVRSLSYTISFFICHFFHLPDSPTLSRRPIIKIIVLTVKNAIALLHPKNSLRPKKNEKDNNIPPNARSESEVILRNILRSILSIRWSIVPITTSTPFASCGNMLAETIAEIELNPSLIMPIIPLFSDSFLFSVIISPQNSLFALQKIYYPSIINRVIDCICSVCLEVNIHSTYTNLSLNVSK